jgi:hypothetical protein
MRTEATVGSIGRKLSWLGCVTIQRRGRQFKEADEPHALFHTVIWRNPVADIQGEVDRCFVKATTGIEAWHQQGGHALASIVQAVAIHIADP